MTSRLFPACGYRECNGDYRNESDFENPSLPLYKEQSSLPSLPVPSLEHTASLYLRSVQALVTPDEFRKTKEAVLEFLKPNGDGQKLQERLIVREKEASATGTSWLATWWNTLGYLQVRDPVVFNVSYFFHFADSKVPAQRTQVGRASVLLACTRDFWKSVITGSRNPERIGRGDNVKPLCATAYKYMFNACRIPARHQDSYRIYDSSVNSHVVVMRHHKFFRVELYDNNSSSPLSITEISNQLCWIVENAGGKESAIGALTSTDRDSWADSRTKLCLVDEVNEASLREIESAIIVLCLDDTAPISKSDVSRALWHGDGKNRFYDKIVQLVVFENGKSGILAEHSMLDGMAMTVYAQEILKAAETSTSTTTTATNNRYTKPLVFKMNNKTVCDIEEAELKFAATVADHEVHVETFWGYGKNLMKEMSVSPDAYVQLAIQLAYRKLFNVTAATYEASQVRIYRHGRTETTRSATVESVEFVNSMMSPHAGSSAVLLRSAVKAHVAYMREAAKGQGVDRHLLGLMLCQEKGEESPAMFRDPAFTKSKTWTISTSHLTLPEFDNWGWGEVVPNGVGIAYSIKGNNCQFNIACRRRNWAAPLGHCIEESLLEMRDVLQAEMKRAAKL